MLIEVGPRTVVRTSTTCKNNWPDRLMCDGWMGPTERTCAIKQRTRAVSNSRTQGSPKAYHLHRNGELFPNGRLDFAQTICNAGFVRNAVINTKVVQEHACRMSTMDSRTPVKTHASEGGHRISKRRINIPKAHSMGIRSRLCS